MSGKRGHGHATLPKGWERDGHACGERGMESDPFAVHLSPTQRTVAAMLAMGHSNGAIADVLRISIKTVDSHRTSIMAKLRCANNVELARLAIRHKRVPSP